MTEDLSTLNLIELLDLLEPVPEPTPISLWPQTQAWLWLALAIVLAAFWFVRRFIAMRRANRYRREALAAIDAAGDDPAVLAAILRRSALSAYPRKEIAGLYGEDWLRFLDSAYGGNGFREGPGRALALAPYVPLQPLPELTPIARKWAHRHRRPGGLPG